MNASGVYREQVTRESLAATLIQPNAVKGLPHRSFMGDRVNGVSFTFYLPLSKHLRGKLSFTSKGLLVTKKQQNMSTLI